MNERPTALLTAWILSTGKRGHEVKGIGVAEALGAEVMVKRVELGFPWSVLAPYGAPPLPAALKAEPAPQLVFASGRRTVPLAQALRRRLGSRAYFVALDDPKLASERFDFVWASEHDGLSGANVFSTVTAPHMLTAARIEQQGATLRAELGPFLDQSAAPLVGVLLGGPSRAYRFGTAEIGELARNLASAQRLRGARLLVTVSRRTPPATLDQMRAALDPALTRLFPLDGPNPYSGMLALCSHFVVTADSANMLGEAASTGRPIHAVRLPGRSRKFDQFHNALKTHGALRWFEGGIEDWTYIPLDSTPLIAAAIRQRLVRAGLLPTTLSASRAADEARNG